MAHGTLHYDNSLSGDFLTSRMLMNFTESLFCCEIEIDTKLTFSFIDWGEGIIIILLFQFESRNEFLVALSVCE